jgi:hypothetical protein
MSHIRDIRRSKPARPRKRGTIFAGALLCLPLAVAELFLATTTLNLDSVEIKVVVGKTV